MKTAISVCGGILALSAVFATPAQQTRLERDIEFVRKVATELGMINLAKMEVENLQRAHRDSASFKLVSQLGIEISLIGARSHPNREERRTLFKESLEKSKQFIDATEGEPVADAARLTLIEACFEYGRFLLDEITLAAETAPENIKELEERAASVYRDGVDACDKAMSTLRSSAQDQGSTRQRDYFRCWLFKGVLLRENARGVKKDRAHLAVMARDALEELIFEVGEESALGLRAYFEMSKIGEVVGKVDESIRDYLDTIDSISKSLRDEEGVLNLNQAAKEFLFDLMQEAYDRAAEAMFMQGRVDDVLALGGKFREHLKEFGVAGVSEFEAADPTYGHSVFLTEARAMAESGKPDLVKKALPQAQRINDEHPSDVIGIKAKAVMKDILDSQADAVSGALLFEVAKGDYQAREYEGAIQGLKRAFAAMTDAERQKHGLELWETVGKSFGSQERYLEAALALCYGLETYGDVPDAATENPADLLEKAWQGFLREAKTETDPEIELVRDRVTKLLTRFGGTGSEAKLKFRDATQHFTENRFAEAAAKYSEVPEGTPYFDPAQGRIAISWVMVGAHDKARKAIAEYRKWLSTPTAKIPDDRKDLRVNRAQTVATVDFYEAYMDYREASGQAGGKSDPTRYADIIARLQSFVTQHRQVAPAGYVSRSYDMMSRMYASLGQIDKAEEFYRTLRNEDANSALLPLLATQIFATHYETVKSLETELKALTEKTEPGAKLDGVRRSLESARRAAVASGLEYMRNATEPQYGVLWNTLTIASDLSDWKTVEEVANKTIAAFEQSPTDGQKVQKFVKPLLAEAYLRQLRMREAEKLLTDAEKASPSDYPIKRLLCLAEGGWLELDQRGNATVVPGVGKPVQAYERYWTEYKKYALNPTRGVTDFSYDWYQFHFECYWFAHEAGKQDSKYREIAETLYNIAKSLDDFQTLRRMGQKGEDLYILFQTVKGR